MTSIKLSAKVTVSTEYHRYDFDSEQEWIEFVNQIKNEPGYALNKLYDGIIGCDATDFLGEIVKVDIIN